MPTILSGNRLAYLDPHEEIWQKETGKWYDIPLNAHNSDTFAPFENLCRFSVHAGNFAGTLFRFPLRNVRREKGVSSHLYNVYKLRELLKALQDEAKCILLFLRSVRTVKVFEIPQNGAHQNLLEVSIRETPNDQLGSKRSRFQQQLETLFKNQSYSITNTLEQVVHVQVGVNDYQDQTRSSQSKWLVANRVGSQSEEVRKVTKELKVFPWVGVALETSLAEAERGGGRVFCVLPMPIDVSCNLPVHVNGTFSLNDERRQLKWPGSERKNDQSAQWNHLIVENLLPPCYASLLLVHAKMLLQPEQFYKAWPDTSRVGGTHWEKLLTPLLGALFSQQAVCSYSASGIRSTLWIKVSSATFIPSNTELPGVVASALSACGEKLVSVPANIWNALKHCRISVTTVTPSLTRDRLRKFPNSYISFSPNQKLELLRYCLLDNAYGDLNNLTLLPLADGTFTSFVNQLTFSQAVYLCSKQCPRDLLPNLDNELVDIENDLELFLKMKAVAEHRYTQLKVLTTTDIATLLPRAMPQEWQRQTIPALPHSRFPTDWFEKFWRWVTKENLKNFSNQFVIPVSDSQTQSVARLSKTSPSLFIPRTENCSQGLVSALGKLQVKCCLQSKYRYIQHIYQLSSLMNYFSADGVLDAIRCASQYNVASLTKEEAHQLRVQIHGCNLIQQRINVVKSLPIFTTLENSNEKLYSVFQVSAIRSAQMEPLSFPLSANNLPSNIILFSSSDYYQKELLQKVHVPCPTTVDLLISLVFPLIEVGSMGKTATEQLMKEVLEKYDVISNADYRQRENFRASITRLQFVPVSVGVAKAPNTLFSPSVDELKNLFLDEPVFPIGPFSTGRCITVLRSCGLKTSVSPQEIVEIINAISSSASTCPQQVNETRYARAKAVLAYISRWGTTQLSVSVFIGSSGYYSRNRVVKFSEALKELSQNKSWLPVQASPPHDYPTCLTWKGSGNACHFVSFGSSVLLRHNQESFALICGSQMYFIDHSLPKEICNVFAPGPAEIVQHTMAHFEEVILNHTQIPRLEQVKTITQLTYKLLHNYQRQGYQVQLSLLQETEDCVWISRHKKFVHPHAIALKQNSSFRQNLEPFVYTLPDDLEQFTSLFEDLGVETTVTKSQIMGILEKIKDGDSESLGVSSDEAWQLVMSILNWLTDNGESLIDDSDVDSLYVPTETDTEWPTLVEYESVVYTDSDFLKRYLAASDESEDTYTFVNHRVSSQLSHQLMLTPLSRHLDISEDAFEDVGQSEPLTVRLRNILKDYKDGLTIVKELLQNADDAGASEMNVCYDARCHTEKRESLFFPGMAECHGPALVVHNNAKFTQDDFQNITKLAGATKAGKALKIGKFGVGFCSVYHITDIPSFVSHKYLYIFDPTLTYLKDEIKNPARPGKKVTFNSKFISKSKQLAPYVGLFGFNPQNDYEGTMFRFPFRSTSSELSGKIYTEDDVKQLMVEIQSCSSKLLLFLQNIECVTVSQIDPGQESSRELMKITKTTQSQGSRCIHQVTCTVSGSPSTTDYWLVETATETVLTGYSTAATASVACSLLPLGGQCFQPKQVEGEMFCFLPLSIKTGLPVHVSSNFAVSNNRRGIWTSDEDSRMADEVQWNESLMKGVISSAYYELLEALKELHTDSSLEDYEFFSMWPLEARLKVHNPWYLSVQTIYSESIESEELFYSVSIEQWLTLENSKFLASDILKLSHSSSIPSAVVDVVNCLQLPVVNLPTEYHKHLDLGSSLETEQGFLEHFFDNIDELEPIVDSRNEVLCLALECYASELQRQEERFDYLQDFFQDNACVPCGVDGELLRKCDKVINPSASFAKLFDPDEKLFPLKEFCDKKLVKQAMIELGMLHNSIPLKLLEERAKGIAELYEQEPIRALERVQCIIECLLEQDKSEGFTTERCDILAGTKFLPVLPKPDDYPLPWKGDEDNLCSGKELLLKGVTVRQDDNTNLNIAGSQVAFVNQELIQKGGCGFLSRRARELLQIRDTPSYKEVISHFQQLIETFTESSQESVMVKWADRISRQVYGFLDNVLKSKSSEEPEEADVSPLTNLACIWTAETFIECSIVAKEWKQDGPYLFKIPRSIVTRTHLLKALQIKESFTIEDFANTLQCLKRDYGTAPLPDKCQLLVREIVAAFPSQRLEVECGPFMLPDVDFVLHEATELFFNDMPWNPPEKDYVFVHDIVPLATAKNLGVQLCRSASLAKYSVPGSHFKVMQFGQHEELTRRIQNIIHDYPFDMTILKELLQNADDSRATKMYVILDKRQHSSEHILSEKWQQLQGPALLVWNDSVFSKDDLEGIQKLGLGSKRSDAETIGQYGIGFNAVYHLTDCPSFLTGGDTLCVLDPHIRYVPEATDRYPGAMYGNLDDGFWNSFDGMKFPYLREGPEGANLPKELLNGSLFRFPLRHTHDLARSSDIVKDITDDLKEVVISGKRMHGLLDEWAPKMKQSLFFLNNVTELKFFVIEDSRGVLKLQHSYRTELTESARDSRLELVQKIKAFSETREPYVTDYPLMIIESLPRKGKDQKEEWLIQQGIGDIEEKVKTWSYIKQVKPRHGIAAPLKQGQVPLYGQVFCFLPLPLLSGLPVHINGHFILNSTRRNLGAH